MKKLLLLLILTMSFGSRVASSQVPNGDFETLLHDGTLSNWGNVTLLVVMIDSAGNVIEDSLIFDGPFCGVSTDAHSGNYALEMRNMLHYNFNETQNGWASVDEDTLYSAWGSLEFIYSTIQPQDFNFYYKFTSVNGDSAIARLTFYDYLGNTIGEANFIISGSNSIYSYASAPVNYFTIDPVASYSLNFSNYYSLADFPTGPNFGTRLIIDDVTLTGTTGLADVNSDPQFIIYPNPCSEFISVTNSNSSEYKIYNMQGEIVQVGMFTDDSSVILKNKYPKGIYTLELNIKGRLRSKNFVIN